MAPMTSNVGEIGDVVLTADGKIDAYIIDVGGFLGVGEKEVAIGSDNLAFMTDRRQQVPLHQLHQGAARRSCGL